VPAPEIEALIIKSVCEHLKIDEQIDDNAVVEHHVARIEVRPQQLVIQLTDDRTADQPAELATRLVVDWQKAASQRRREILVPEGSSPDLTRPIRSENRATLVASIARGRRWLQELIADPLATLESIAERESCSVRKVSMTISLAFLAPDLIKAAVDGRLPHKMGVTCLADLPAEWSRQHQILGLRTQ
jgi:site-specific DNA recombinase